MRGYGMWIGGKAVKGGSCAPTRPEPGASNRGFPFFFFCRWHKNSPPLTHPTHAQPPAPFLKK